MKSGILRHYVEIERLETTQDSNGEVEETWSHVAFAWAAIEALSAREFMAAQREESRIGARITIRWRDDLDSTCRIVHKGEYYNIEGVLPDKKSMREYLTLPVSIGTRDDR